MSKGNDDWASKVDVEWPDPGVVGLVDGFVDVERLRRALHEAGIGCKPNVPYCRATHRGHAERIAEKYNARRPDGVLRDTGKGPG